MPLALRKGALLAQPSSMELSEWHEFDIIRRQNDALWREKLPKGITTRINIFKARFVLASGLSSLTFIPAYDDDTSSMYLAGTKLLLAYSAAEAFLRTEDLFKSRKKSYISAWTLARANLASDLRPIAKLILDSSDSHGNLDERMKAKLLKFYNSRKSDVMPLASALRHIHAHGGLTARSLTGASVDTSSNHAAAINSLAQALLEKCDEKFSSLVRQIAISLNESH